ncbi:MAG: sigma-70 family RNA polymerase sigma factor [Anaeromyxobacter sp.]
MQPAPHASAPAPEVVARLVGSHRAFLGFLEKRLPSRAAAEEVLQDAFVRTMERGGELRDGEGAVAWFYRLLRNAVADWYRRGGAEARALEREAREATEADEPELRRVICACMGELLTDLKPEYAELLRRVDLEEVPVADAAAALDITVNNAHVRLHRARRALKGRLEAACGTCATHGCLDCTCGGG